MFYEALIFLSWSFTVIHLIIETQLPWTGTILAPTALFLNAFASFQLPESLQKHNSLIPALQSNWLMMHVTVMLLSYATLITGCVLAIALLALTGPRPPMACGLAPEGGCERFAFREAEVSSTAQASLGVSCAWLSAKLKSRHQSGPLTGLLASSLRSEGCASPRRGEAKPIGAGGRPMAATFATLGSPPTGEIVRVRVRGTQPEDPEEIKNLWPRGKPKGSERDFFLFEIEKMKILNQLDQLSFRSIGIGFPLLTVGILSGSVWANEAWGSYWSWDPKETWSFITWIIFAIYLHLRLNKKWSGVKSAILATIGFFVVWICFLGVNFLAKGLHSYGWFV